MWDEWGFSSLDLSSRQSRRLRIRGFTARNQWRQAYPCVDSLLSDFAAYVHVADGGPSPAAERLRSLVVLHGIDGAYRSRAYSRIAELVGGAPASAQQVPFYAELLRHSISAVDGDTVRQIELDLPRTFCEQRDFTAANAARSMPHDGSRSSLMDAAASDDTVRSVLDIGGGSIQDALRRILRAFCAQHPSTGYLQSMNFVAAFALLVHGAHMHRDAAGGAARLAAAEAAAYTTFSFLCGYALRGYYSEGMELLRADGDVFRAVLRERMPALSVHCEAAGGGVDISALFVPRWLLCAYLNVFPADIVVRVWDAVMLATLLDGPPAAARVLVETALAVVRVVEGDLLAAPGFVEIAEVLRTLHVRVSDAAELMLLAATTCALSGSGTADGSGSAEDGSATISNNGIVGSAAGGRDCMDRLRRSHSAEIYSVYVQRCAAATAAAVIYADNISVNNSGGDGDAGACAGADAHSSAAAVTAAAPRGDADGARVNAADAASGGAHAPHAGEPIETELRGTSARTEDAEGCVGVPPAATSPPREEAVPKTDQSAAQTAPPVSGDTLSPSAAHRLAVASASPARAAALALVTSPGLRILPSESESPAPLAPPAPPPPPPPSHLLLHRRRRHLSADFATAGSGSGGPGGRSRPHTHARRSSSCRARRRVRRWGLRRLQALRRHRQRRAAAAVRAAAAAAAVASSATAEQPARRYRRRRRQRHRRCCAAPPALAAAARLCPCAQ